jgi:rubrerythrin
MAAKSPIDDPIDVDKAARGASRLEPDRVDDLEQLVSASSDLQCGTCGYGIAAYVTPPDCPMCGQRAWRPVSGAPLRSDPVSPAAPNP